jgi:excisionase family DNA binding protein
MTQQQQEKQTFTVEEAAKILGIGRQTAYDLARKGTLPGGRRLGRRFIVSKSELEAYLHGPFQN